MTEEQLNAKRNEIGAALKNRRLYLGLTQEQLAEKVGVERETISRMEGGKFWLVTKQYVKIAYALGLNPFSELFSKQ